HVSMADVQGILSSGKSIQYKLTAAEGLTSEMIFKIVADDPVLTGDAGWTPPEGSLLPETYLFTRGTTRAQMLGRMMKARDALLEQLWRERPPGLPYKTPNDAVVLASIVEKETAIPAERRHVAAVFVNRLKLGMKLQSDPTIIYDVTRGYPLGRGIRESELTRASPHNTYFIAGLPPTPICNPGKDSLAAVLDPATSNDLYFVANGQGGHVFSATMEAQNRNVALWRKVEQARKPQLSGAQLRK
ncbi:MAG: endolytic transglycosylase MltG, partial [Alphaproteobacteria bacterium]|nr:endolytic transglycosylase MltG [Alphaproteobacteria bacterium]